MVAFEVYNLLAPLLAQKRSSFKIPWFNVAFDTLIDLCFFWLGCCFFAVEKGNHEAVNWLFAFILLITFVGFCYWYSLKIVIQNARFPIQFRLSQWSKPISDADYTSIVDFIGTGKPDNKHLLIFGSKMNGKTSLAVGIATECSYKRCKGFYISANKLIGEFNSEIVPSSFYLWSLKEADVLVIDDINPGFPFSDVVNATTFERLLMHEENFIERNKNILKTKAVIWVLGNQDCANDAGKSWIDMLIQIGIDENNIATVNI